MTAPPRWRVACACGWIGYRVHPSARPCPRCELEQVAPCWRAGEAPSRAAGTVYLVHLDPPFQHARHYLGTAASVRERFAAHAGGTGSRLLAAAAGAGSRLILVRTWPGGRDLERTFKQRAARPSPGTRSGRRRGAAVGLARYCPMCNPSAARNRPVAGQWLLTG